MKDGPDLLAGFTALAHIASYARRRPRRNTVSSICIDNASAQASRGGDCGSTGSVATGTRTARFTKGRTVMNRSSGRVLQIGATILLISGCFSYIPTELTSVPQGQEVRLHLTRQGLAALPEIPNQAGLTLTGKLVESGEDRLRVRVPIAIQQDAIVTRTLGQELVIPANAIVQVERRTFNRGRSALVLLGGAVVAAVAYASFRDSGPESPDLPGEPGEPEGMRARMSFTLSRIW
jgi:hypothetical protein